jgi:hypothetical protein
MPSVINSFSGKYRFLSNFFPCMGGICLDPENLSGDIAVLTFPNTESAYQYMKFFYVNAEIASKIYENKDNPGACKKIANQYKDEIDQDFDRIRTMYLLLKKKFQIYTDAGKMLLATNDSELIEGNHWGDSFWGVCNDVGSNNLGKMLMNRRAVLRAQFKEYLFVSELNRKSPIPVTEKRVEYIFNKKIEEYFQKYIGD